MGANSAIEWTDHTVNFWIGCAKVSPACDHCYAERDWAMTGRHKRVEWGPHGARSPTKDPLAQVRSFAAGAARRGQRERVFVNSLSDWADNHKSIDPAWRAEIFEAARLYPGLDFLLLTKRPQNIASFLPGDWGAGYPNVWLGTTVENQQEADRRIPHLLATPAAVRFVSAEPLLSRVDFRSINDAGAILNTLTGASSDYGDPDAGMIAPVETSGPRLDWIIVGGESGPVARPMHPDWARTIRDQCAAAGVSFFFKQWGEWGPIIRPPVRDAHRWPIEHGEPEGGVWSYRVGKARAGRTLDGRTHDDMPKPAAP